MSSVGDALYIARLEQRIRALEALLDGARAAAANWQGRAQYWHQQATTPQPVDVRVVIDTTAEVLTID